MASVTCAPVARVGDDVLDDLHEERDLGVTAPLQVLRRAHEHGHVPDPGPLAPVQDVPAPISGKPGWRERSKPTAARRSTRRPRRSAAQAEPWAKYRTRRRTCGWHP